VGAELDCLHLGPKREIFARNPRRKADIVLNTRRGPGLAADRGVLDHKGRQTFRGAVNSRRQTGRPRSNHNEIAWPALLPEEIESDRARKIERARSFERASPIQNHSEHIAFGRSACRDGRSVARIVRVEPTVRDAIAVGKLEQP
jgi:hypothetical protein